MKRGYADTRNGQTHYREAGTGPAVMLLHQTPASGLVYSRLAPVIAERFRVIVPDNPGFGGSDKLRPGTTLHDIAGGFVDLMDELEVDRFRLFGLHTGATLVAEIATGWPDRVAAAVLGGFPFLELEEQAERMRMAEVPMGQRGGLPVVIPESDGAHLVKLWQRGYQRVIWGQGQLPDEVLSPIELKFMDDYFQQTITAWESITDTFKAVYSYNSRERLPLIKSPTLLLEATGPYERSYCKRSDILSGIIPNTQTVKVEGADAYCVYWRAEDVGAALIEFFESVEA